MSCVPLRLSLAGTVLLALLGGLGGAAIAQEESAAAIDPKAPGFFMVTEDNGDSIVASDPRFSGTLVEGEFGSIDIDPVHNQSVYWGEVRIENDEGAWQGWTSGFSWGDTPPWHEQAWYVGEGAYEGLTAVGVGQWCPGGDDSWYGIIFEGEVPRLQPPSE